MKYLFVLLAIAVSASGFADEANLTTQSIASFDGFKMETVLELPKGMASNEIKKVFVFVHGSGAQSLDEDLSAVTAPKGTKNLFFKDVAQALNGQQFATLRYNKRSFEVKKRIAANAKYKDSEEFKKYAANPLENLIQDASHFVDHVKKEFPSAQVYILGHSEGTAVALNVAQRNKNVSGVALIGFSNEPITSSLLEQVVFRPQGMFRDLDKNRNEILEPKELKAKGEIAESIREQMFVLDLDKDGSLSFAEFNAGNYSNLVLRDDLYSQNYQIDEAKLPRPSDIIKKANFKILFLQGEYDNQTPVYYAQALDLINRVSLKKQNLKFVYFKKAGHALDPRQNLADLNYHTVPPETLKKIAAEAATFF